MKDQNRDKVYTPLKVAAELIAKIPADPGDTWCDCCRGKGAFFNQFPTRRKSWYEIDDGKDFLKCDKKYDWIVSNIPFSQPAEFLFKMAECARKGFGLVCLACSITPTRLKTLEGMGWYPHSCTMLYIREWDHGYRTDFYVFTRNRLPYLSHLIK